MRRRKVSEEFGEEKARKLGHFARRRGLASVPALDPDFMRLINGRAVGSTKTVELIDAWVDGWSDARDSAKEVA